MNLMIDRTDWHRSLSRCGIRNLMLPPPVGAVALLGCGSLCSRLLYHLYRGFLLRVLDPFGARLGPRTLIILDRGATLLRRMQSVQMQRTRQTHRF